MTRPSPRENQKRARWRWLGLALAVVLAALVWRAAHRRNLVLAAVPPPPRDVSGNAAVADEVINRETLARGWLHPERGLAALSSLYHANGFYPEALQCYEGLRRLEPREARWPHLEASILAEFGRLEEALPLRQDALRLAPDYLPVRVRSGDVLLKANRVKEAEAAYRGALTLEPDDPYALLGLARGALAGNDWPKARDLLRQAIAKHPDFVGGLSLLITVSERLGDTAAASAAKTAMGNREFSDLPDAWLDRLADDCYDPYRLSIAAALANAAGNLPAAADRLERAIVLAPNSGAYRRQYARLLMDQGNSAPARQQLEKAVLVAPEDADSWLLLVQNLAQAGETARAESVLANALAACPQSPSLHLERARMLNATGRGPEAIAEYRESYRLRPSEVAPLIELATVYFTNQRVDDATAALHEALQKMPEQPVALGTLALIAVSKGDEPDARNWWARLRGVNGVPPALLNSVRQAFQQRFGLALP